MQKRLTGILGTIALVVAGTLTAAAPAAAFEPTSQTGPVRLGDPASERFALAGNPILSTKIAMVPPSDPGSWYHLNQQWYLRDAGAGGVTIVNARQFFGAGDWCLVPPVTPAVEPFAVIYFCTGSPEQVWQLDPVSSGDRLISQSRGDCLTIPPVGAPSHDLRLQPCGGPGQVFAISPGS